MAGVLEGLPGAFKKMTVLRIKDGRLTRRKTEKPGVETFHVGEIIGGPYIVGIGKLFRTDPVFQHFLRAEPARAHTFVRQQIPELCDIPCRRKSSGHADDSDLFRSLNSLNTVCHNTCSSPPEPAVLLLVTELYPAKKLSYCTDVPVLWVIRARRAAAR